MYFKTWLETLKIIFVHYNKKRMAPGGIEPTTFALLARRSNQLSYGARYVVLRLLKFKKKINKPSLIHCFSSFFFFKFFQIKKKNNAFLRIHQTAIPSNFIK